MLKTEKRRVDKGTGKKWPNSATFNGTRENLVQLGPKLSRVLLSESNQEQRIGKYILKIIKRTPERDMNLLDNIITP